MGAFRKSEKVIPKRINQVDQKVMDELKRHVGNEVLICQFDNTDKSINIRNYTLKEVLDFRHVKVEDGAVIPFISTDRAVLWIGTIENVLKIIYENEFISQGITPITSIQDSIFTNRIRILLGLGVDLLRGLSFGAEVAGILEEDLTTLRR